MSEPSNYPGGCRALKHILCRSLHTAYACTSVSEEGSGCTKQDTYLIPLKNKLHHRLLGLSHLSLDCALTSLSAVMAEGGVNVRSPFSTADRSRDIAARPS